MELVTGSLNGEQILEEVLDISNLFASNGIEKLLVEFGWGANLNTEELWREIEVCTRDLAAFVKGNADKKVFASGKSDLFIRDIGRTVQFKLCHEGDIHLTTENDAFFRQVERLWVSKGFRGYKASSQSDWIPVG